MPLRREGKHRRNKDYHRRNKRRGRARKRWRWNKGRDQSDRVRARLFDEQDGKCGICQEPMVLGQDKLSVDHIVPLSKGGSSRGENLQLTHHKCNQKKGNA